MRSFILAAGAASLAIAMPALAQGKGNGNGGGKEHGPHSAHVKQGSGKGHGNGGAKAQRVAKGADRIGRGNGNGQIRIASQNGKGHGKGHGKAFKAEAKRAERFDRHDVRIGNKVRERDIDRIAYRDRRDDRIGYRGRGQRFATYDCPPGLAKKSPACVPPGQAKKAWNVGQVIPAAYYGGYNVPRDYRDLYYDNDDYYYRYDGGNIYRIDRTRNLVSGLIPLLGGGFGVGSLLPAGYDVYNVPLQYRDMYSDTDDHYYRYGDGAIYRVDPQTNMVSNVMALLTNDLRVGQPLPTGYDVYNVPLDYRDQYYDTDDAWYRYADNSIYQVDPTTQLITAVISLLT